MAIYLDYNATTPVAMEVLAAMAPFWTEEFYNPSATYPESQVPRAAVETARAQLAELLGADPKAVVFTGGGTESNNWALRGAWDYWRGQRRRIVISAIEHPAIQETATALQAMGAEIVKVPVDGEGVLRMDALNAAIDERTALVSIMLANNEIGTLQPLAVVTRLAHGVGAWVHTDAAQAVGKVPVDVAALDIDLLSVAGHKFYAPKGIGALYIRPGIALPSLLRGGGQEDGRRSGTEPVPLIVGLGQAAQLSQAWLAGGGVRQQVALRDALESRLIEKIPEVHIFGRKAARLPNTIALAHPRFFGAELLAACPTFRAGTGSACHHPDDGGSPTLLAMGVSGGLARGLIRLSFGRRTTQADLGAAAQDLVQAIHRR